MKPTITLTCICGNEQVHAARFFDAFAPAFDELVIARAVGIQKPDDTIGILAARAKKAGKKFRWVEYRNAPGHDWPHVDDFGAARNASLAMATGDVIFWADFDDYVSAGEAAAIRECAESILSPTLQYKPTETEPYRDASGRPAVVAFCKYDLPTQGEELHRERLFTRSCSPRWTTGLHETLRHTVPAVQIRAEITISHLPLENPTKDRRRNLRILRGITESAVDMIFERGRQAYIDAIGDRETGVEQTRFDEARRFLQVSAADPALPPERRYQLLIMLAHMDQLDGGGDPGGYLWQATRLYPHFRDAWAQMAEWELERGNPTRALSAVLAFVGQRKPAPSGYQVSGRYYGWNAADLLCRTRRACGEDPEADIATQAERAGGFRIALIHATRGRPKKAAITRRAWHEAAAQPDRIWHVFVADDDDSTGDEIRKTGARLLINEGRSCVSAWNLGAKEADKLQIPIIVQLSDDWIPCMGWDRLIWDAVEKAGDPIKKEMAVKVSNGSRRDSLMCMAIMSLARYRRQGFMFSPDYFGVFSDTEYSYRAEMDGIIVDATHVHLRHTHPVFGLAKMDATYERQNAAERYREGREIFLRRNPAGADMARDATENHETENEKP